MLITREVDYALRLLRNLSDGEQRAVRTLSQQEMVPQHFAYKILSKLSHAGFVFVSRGAEGGCRLTSDLREKTLYDLMEVMGAIAPINACMDSDYQCTWRNNSGKPCLIHATLGTIQDALNTELSSHSLASLMLGEDENEAVLNE